MDLFQPVQLLGSDTLILLQIDQDQVTCLRFSPVDHRSSKQTYNFDTKHRDPNDILPCIPEKKLEKLVLHEA